MKKLLISTILSCLCIVSYALAATDSITIENHSYPSSVTLREYANPVAFKDYIKGVCHAEIGTFIVG